MRHIYQRSSSAARTPVGLRAPALLPASARVCPRLPASAARRALIARSSNPRSHPVTRPSAPPARACGGARVGTRKVGGRTRERERDDRAPCDHMPRAQGPCTQTTMERTWYVLSNLSYMKRVIIDVLPTL